MQKQNISSKNTAKIQRIETVVLNDDVELVDVTVKDDHTFWVSQNGSNWMLTHNSGAPDIDVDVSDRDKVLTVLREEFGYNNVVPISNYNAFKVKTLIKDLSKFHGISFDEANVATRTVDAEVRKATQKHGDDKNLFVLTFEDSMKYSPSFKTFVDAHPEIVESITVLFKEQRSLGRHAGGVVIMDDAPTMLPLITSGGEPQTPWVEGVGGKFLEPLGVIKYDLLGLETMRLIERTIELILQKNGVANPTFAQVREWYEKHLHPDVNDYDDQDVYEYVYHKGKFAGIFQLTSQGAQRLFKKAKPTSILDIAVLTSIYRPGPLAAKVDDIYLKAKQGEKFDWGHPLFEKVLGKTYNCLIFQEDVMQLAEVIGQFPKDQCDNVRRAIMKRDLSKGESAIKEAKALEDKFVEGAVAQGILEQTARKAYQNILWFAGYGFNRAHAIAYAIDSYMCAWLLYHHEEQWLSAYIESMSKNPEDKARAFGEAKALGYNIVPIDVNYASAGWSVLPGKKFMPSLLSCKGLGETAAEELMQNRPFTSIEQMLWNEDGTWRLSKFNKKALDALIRVGAFASLDCVGEGKLFDSYHHMHEVIVENMDFIKKSSKKDPHLGRKTFFELARALSPMPEWSRKEQAENQVEVLGSLDVTSMLEPEVMERLFNKGVKAVDEWTQKDFYWFCVMDAVPKKTKTGKNYLLLRVAGTVGKEYRMNVWGWDGIKEFPPLSVFLAEVDKNDFGLSTTAWRCKGLT
jgi:DNA polymerase III alpha subunit